MVVELLHDIVCTRLAARGQELANTSLKINSALLEHELDDLVGGRTHEAEQEINEDHSDCHVEDG